LSGISRFRVKEEVSGFTPYRRCSVDWGGFQRDLGPAEDDPGFARGVPCPAGPLFRVQNLSTDWSSMKEAETELLINSLSMLCPFARGQAGAAGGAVASTRRETLVTLIEFALRGGSGEEVMQ
jgi:uncharacterized protein